MKRYESIVTGAILFVSIMKSPLYSGCEHHQTSSGCFWQR